MIINLSFLFCLFIYDVLVELLEIYLVVMVEIAILQQFINKHLVLGVFFLIGLEDDL